MVSAARTTGVRVPHWLFVRQNRTGHPPPRWAARTRIPSGWGCRLRPAVEGAELRSLETPPTPTAAVGCHVALGADHDYHWSMADILSQDELDALLGEMQDGEDGDEAEEVEEAEEAVEADDAVEAEDESPEIPAESPAVRRPSAPVAELSGDVAEGHNIDLILSIPIELQVELGRTRMSVHELLQLGQGSVIELTRLASDLIDLSVNNKVVANGEAVVVNENFGFRVVEVDSVRGRIEKL